MVFGGRVLTVLNAVFLWSIYQRNNDLLDGGDNLARILIIFLVLTVTDAYYSPLAGRRREKMAAKSAQNRASVVPLVHNSAVFVITFQIAVVYFCAGMWKIAGALWQDGTAMYYINRTLDFRFLSLGGLTSNSITTTFLTYFAIFANIAFPIGLLTKRFRYVTVGAAMLMHFGIITVMGLVGFGLTMMGADLACLSDEEYEGVFRFVLRVRDGVASRWRRLSAAEPAEPAEPAELESPVEDLVPEQVVPVEVQ
jgi:hypothetical protein